MIIASIDIGTNSVLLTIVKEENGFLTPIIEEATITRLGEAIDKNGHFLPEAMDRTLEALRHYKQECDEHDVRNIIIVGTAAMRRSSNSNDFIKRARDKLNLSIDIITGEREAELSYLAVSHDFGKDSIVIDIGGGSTEIIKPMDNNTLNLVSLPLGAVVLHEQCVTSDPINDNDFEKITHSISKIIHKCQAPVDNSGGQLVATAGTATTLAAMKLKLEEYSHVEVHGHTLTIDEIDAIIGELKKLTINERKQLPGLEAKRADVILPGALILRTAMESLGLNEVTVSDRGVRWGLIYENYK